MRTLAEYQAQANHQEFAMPCVIGILFGVWQNAVNLPRFRVDLLCFKLVESPIQHARAGIESRSAITIRPMILLFMAFFMRPEFIRAHRSMRNLPFLWGLSTRIVFVPPFPCGNAIFGTSLPIHGEWWNTTVLCATRRHIRYCVDCPLAFSIGRETRRMASLLYASNAFCQRAASVRVLVQTTDPFDDEAIRRSPAGLCLISPARGSCVLEV